MSDSAATPALSVDHLSKRFGDRLAVLAVSSLIAFDVIHATLGLAVGLAALLLVLDRLGWRIVSAMFDRERLITGA